MKKSLLIAVATLLLSIGATTVFQPQVSAVDPQNSFCKGIGGSRSGEGCDGVDSEGATTDYASLIRTVFNIFTFLAGAVAVIMIIIGGFKYVTSNGDNSQVSSAKSTITYAVVGLAVVLSAYAIVDFIADQFLVRIAILPSFLV